MAYAVPPASPERRACERGALGEGCREQPGSVREQSEGLQNAKLDPLNEIESSPQGVTYIVIHEGPCARRCARILGRGARQPRAHARRGLRRFSSDPGPALRRFLNIVWLRVGRTQSGTNACPSC